MRSRREIEQKLAELERAVPSEELCEAKPELYERRVLLRGAIQALRWALSAPPARSIQGRGQEEELLPLLRERRRERMEELLRQIEEVKRRGQGQSSRP